MVLESRKRFGPLLFSLRALAVQSHAERSCHDALRKHNKPQLFFSTVVLAAPLIENTRRSPLFASCALCLFFSECASHRKDDYVKTLYSRC